MSIATALTALADDVDAAKAAITAKGGTAPSGTADMADAIAAIPSGGGGLPVQSGVFTPAMQDAKFTITVNDDVAANPFVCIFSVDEEQTPVNLSLVQVAYFVPDPSVNITGGNQWIMQSSGAKFINTIVSGATVGSWTAASKKLTLSARGGSNFYAGAQYSYMIIPLSSLASVWR